MPIADRNFNSANTSFLSTVLTIIQHRLPDASPIIQKRIAYSIASKRARFDDIQQHQQDSESFAASTDVMKSHEPEKEQLQEVANPLAVKPRSPSIAANTVTSVSISVFDIKEFQHTFVPSVITATTLGVAVYHPYKLSVQDIPPPPRVPKSSNEVECPYCLVTLLSNDASGARWRFVILNICS